MAGCLAHSETHGIMGFISILRKYHYGASKEIGPGTILPILREAFNEESVQRCFGRLEAFCEPEDLWCVVHGKINDKRKEDKTGISKRSTEVSKGELRELRNKQNGEHPSHRHGLEQQCSCQFDDVVRELSSEIALGEWKRNAQKAEITLFRMWQESRGERFLHEPLQALYEVWRSVTDQEIGAFRRHYSKRDEHRVNRLKALGNSIVPQVALQIMRAIKETDRKGEICQ
jgi:hypothetical protein